MTTDAPRLTPAQARKFAILRTVLVGSLVGSVAAFLAGIALLFVPSASAALRSVTWGVFIEMAVSSAVLGAFARCPACRGRIGGQSKGLLPARCPACGVALEKNS